MSLLGKTKQKKGYKNMPSRTPNKSEAIAAISADRNFLMAKVA
jgi:hypothetical protein